MARCVLLSPEAFRLQSDTGSSIVLTPNPRAARSLGVTPISIEQYARKTLRQHGLLVASELVRHHALRDAVRAVIGPSDLTGYTRTVRGTVQELMRGGFPYRDPGDDLSPRARHVLGLATHYVERLRAQALVDPAAVLWAAAEACAKRKTLSVIGYPRLGLGEWVFLDAAADDASVLTLPYGTHPSFSLNRELAQRFEASGWQVTHSEVAGEAWTSNIGISAFAFTSQEDEVRSVLSKVKALLHDGVGPEQIVLIARDDALYGPILHDVAWEYEVPVKASYAKPLRETRVGAWLAGLVHILRYDFPFEETARLLSHSLCLKLPREVWVELRTVRPEGYAAWLEHVPALSVLSWPEEATPHGYTEVLAHTLEALGVEERVRVSARDGRVLTKLRQSLGSGSVLTSAAQPIAAFMGDIDDLLRLLTLPVDVATEGVELHTPLAVFGASYAHVFVIGMAEGLLPPTLQDDPVLDFYERKALVTRGLELESAAYAAHRETLSFWAALQTATSHLILSYPQRIGGSATLPSPYFELLGVTPQRPTAKGPASAEEFRQAQLRAAVETDDPVLEGARQSFTVEVERESSHPFGAFDGVTGLPFDPLAWRFSASQLVKLGSCAFSWYAGHVLRLSEPDEAEDEVRVGTRGSFYHTVLEHLLGRVKNSDTPQSAALKIFEQVFAEIEDDLGLTRMPEWPRTRGEHIMALRRVLLAEDFWPENGRIVALEQRFEGVWRGLKVRGVIDRADESADGLVLFDYKTRSSKPPGAKDAEGKRNVDVQLPLYLEAAAPQLFPDAAVARASYYSLTKAKKLPDVKIDEMALTEFIERVKQQLSTGSFPVDPDPEGSACAYCDFDIVCRQGIRLERKRVGNKA